MKKTTLVALTLASLPVAANADVILYGQIKGGVEVTFKEKIKNVKTKGTTTQIVDYGSRIGFKGHEHLTDGLKAIWQLEQQVDIAGGATGTNGVNGFGTRDSFIGLQSESAGTIKAGYLSTPVKDANGRLDDWEYDNKAAGLGIFTRDTDAVKRAVAVSYTTPNMAGLSATAYVSPSENNNGETYGKRRLGDRATYGASVNYENNGFFADVAGTYVKNSQVNQPIKSKHHYQAVAQVGYETDNVLAGVAYQRGKLIEEDFDATNEVAATVAVKASEGLRLKGSAAYGFNLKDNGGNKAFGNGKYYQAIVGADYAFSKRTQVNAQAGYVQAGKDEQKSQTGIVSVGMKHSF